MVPRRMTPSPLRGPRVWGPFLKPTSSSRPTLNDGRVWSRSCVNVSNNRAPLRARETKMDIIDGDGFNLRRDGNEVVISVCKDGDQPNVLTEVGRVPVEQV